MSFRRMVALKVAPLFLAVPFSEFAYGEMAFGEMTLGLIIGKMAFGKSPGHQLLYFHTYVQLSPHGIVATITERMCIIV